MGKKSISFFLVALTGLTTLGMAMLASTNGSSYELMEGYVNFWKQVSWLGLSVVICFGVACVDYHFWQRQIKWLYILAFVGLLCCFIPKIGLNINGSKRWVSGALVGMGGLRIQPSEFSKIVVVAVMAWWYSQTEMDFKKVMNGIIKPLGLFSGLVILIAGEVDLGNTAVLCAVGFAIMFVAGANWKFLLMSGLITLMGIAMTIYFIPNRMMRVLVVMDLEKYKDGMGWQQWLAKLSFGLGGMTGMGFGEGKMLALMPEAHTDFIFPMIGEELGLIGTVSTLILFLILIFSAYCFAAYAPDRFGRLLGFGIATLIAVEALMNMGVTTSMLPNKGLPLRFISYGGSNLMAGFILVGILINIYRQGLHVSRQELPLIRRKQRWTPQI
jgi:cell division protein FtsW